MNAESDGATELRVVAADLARRAGLLALTGRRSIGTDQRMTHDTKSSRTDPVTEYDRAAERLIVDALQALRPQDSILGEEGASREGTSGLTWHIDPIDGTVNYLYDLPMWCTSVAVVDDDGAVAGAVYAPVTDELFTAARGHGASRNDESIHCTDTDELALALVGTGFNYSATMRAAQARRLAALAPHVRDVRRYGSAALDLCMVACGRLDAYFEEGLNSWDLAAGALVAAEAGAVVSDFAGGTPGPDGAVACSAALHPALLDAVAAATAAARTSS